MSVIAEKIVGHLKCVDAERARRNATPGLFAKVNAVKLYQQKRFALTYADLLVSERYGRAARFFLEELYGPVDFSKRDAQFARVVPTLSRLFHGEVVQTVGSMAELHALSEALDTAMGLELPGPVVDARAYVLAWQRSSGRSDRERQIELTVSLGQSLDRLTQKALLRSGLRMMRRPAVAAGLGELQHVLESGFDAFATMHGSQEFLAIVETRERTLADELFAEIVEGSDWQGGANGRLGLP